MRADEVAKYLQDNPKFFEDHAELMSHIYVPHPHGGRAVSITERQIVTLRDKNKALEAKLAELIRFGEENDAIGEKVHRLALALIAAADLSAILRDVYAHLLEDFAVPHVSLRVWGNVLPRDGMEFSPVEESTRLFVAELSRPYCGPAGGIELNAWFSQPSTHVRSMALIPLTRDSQPIGALALGSEDNQRFYPEMGTHYLERIGAMIGAALVRELG